MSYTKAMEVSFCPDCSHAVPPHYLFCPQCGADLSHTPDFEGLLDQCLKPLEEMEWRNNRHRLALLLTRLEVLEEGLGLFLEEGRKDPRASCR